jgi:GntR family transcriptional regulator/MocR family aminotransferase
VLKRSERVPLHRQIATSIRDSIRAGRLPRGSALPPSRVLAADLGVSRGVVVEAYQQLAAEGYLASHAGGYTQVAAGPARPAAPLRLARPQPPRIDLSDGRADVSSFPRAAWLRAIRGALAAAPDDVFGYLAGSGMPLLRTAVADYLNRVRGTFAQPDNVVISTRIRAGHSSAYPGAGGRWPEETCAGGPLVR